jgi:hypothetical protein
MGVVNVSQRFKDLCAHHIGKRGEHWLVFFVHVPA